MSTPGETAWWWCLKHARAEREPDVPAADRLGPYPSQAAAEGWREQFAERNLRHDRLDAEDMGRE